MTDPDPKKGIVVRGRRIPDAELEWRFDTSGGPGGQHANRSATRVELRFDVARSAAFDEEDRRRILDHLGARARDGVVRVVVDETRSQWRNRRIARDRLVALLDEAIGPTRPRRPTKPTAGSRRRRREEKRRRSMTKRLRRPPEPE